MCPKCNNTQLNSEMKIGEPVMFECTECGYYAEYKEFKIEEFEVVINSNLDKIITDLEVIKGYLEQLNSSLV